jgi:hypothetical protein
MLRFQETDLAKDQEILTREQNREGEIYFLGKMYDSFLKAYCKKRSFFLNPKQKPKELEVRKARITTLIKLASDAGTAPEVFMKAQFEQLVPFEIYPAFPILISAKAPERFRNYLRHLERIYVAAGDRQRHQETSVIPNLEKPIARSVRNFYDRLEKVVAITGHLDEDSALRELEVLTRGGDVDFVYVMICPIVSTMKNEYLLGIRSIERKHSDKLIPVAEVIRERLVGTLQNGKAKNYV